MYRVIATLLLLWGGIFVMPARAGDPQKKGFAYYDKVTYEAYLRGDWKRVVRAGREALRKEIDYYYLRMRLGIAWYSRKNYDLAIPHFLRALELSPNDITALQYLYYCYLFGGREDDRHALMHHMPVRVRDEVKAGRLTGLTAFSMETGYFQNPEDLSGYDSGDLPPEEGVQTLVRRGGEGALLFTFQVGENTSIRAGYRYLTKNRLIHYYDLNDGAVTLTDNTFTQHHLHGALHFRLARGLALDLSFNYLNLRTPLPAAGYGNRVFLYTVSSHDATTHFTLSKRFPFLSLSAGAGYAGMNGLQQLQGDGAVFLFPLGNPGLYLGTGITWLSQQGENNRTDLIWSPVAGIRPFGTLWIELFSTFGDMSNYQGPYGWILYNDPNPIRFSAGINVIYIVPRNGMTLTLTPSWSQATSYYFLSGDPTPSYQPVDYNMLNLIFGIKWNF